MWAFEEFLPLSLPLLLVLSLPALKKDMQFLSIQALLKVLTSHPRQKLTVLMQSANTLQLKLYKLDFYFRVSSLDNCLRSVEKEVMSFARRLRETARRRLV